MSGHLPLYKIDEPPTYRKDMNTGLWYDKFCNEWERDFSSRPKDDGKKNWINTVTNGRIGDGSNLSEIMTRREQLLESCKGNALFFKTIGPFVTGLGREHPVENGFAWHHTLGTPYLPGSSVKGMVHNWADQWEEGDAEIIKRIFGPRSRSDVNASVGSVIFMDALPTAPVQLKADVMTPHYGPYYQDDSGETPPADWHNPIPIPFLVVDETQEFLFGIIPRNSSNDMDIKDCRIVEEWLKAALDSIGAGAKTAIGYGRFEKIVKLSKEEKWMKSCSQGNSPNILFNGWEKLDDNVLKIKLANMLIEKYGDLKTKSIKKVKRNYVEYLEKMENDS